MCMGGVESVSYVGDRSFQDSLYCDPLKSQSEWMEDTLSAASKRSIQDSTLHTHIRACPLSMT